MRLIHRSDLKRLGISFSQVESPFFAEFNVRNAFLGRSVSCIFGLDVRTFGRAWSQGEILSAVKSGDLLLVSDEPFSPLSNDTCGNYAFITGKGWMGSFPKCHVSELQPLRANKAMPRPKPKEPGFYIVPRSTTVAALKETLFKSPNDAVMEKFQSLNPALNEVKAGSMIVLSDPNNFQCTRRKFGCRKPLPTPTRL